MDETMDAAVPAATSQRRGWRFWVSFQADYAMSHPASLF